MQTGPIHIKMPMLRKGASCPEADPNAPTQRVGLANAPLNAQTNAKTNALVLSKQRAKRRPNQKPDNPIEVIPDVPTHSAHNLLVGVYFYVFVSEKGHWRTRATQRCWLQVVLRGMAAELFHET
jgi:hypothetical protein